MGRIHSTSDNKSDQGSMSPFRPIQYLGSKLRLVEQISEIVETHKRSNIVCDLFAGSGVVSHFLNRKNQVISVDIQHYSAIISLALTNGYKFFEEEKLSFLNEVITDPIFDELKHVFEPLIKFEDSLLENGFSGQKEKLAFANFVENASVYIFLNSPHSIGKLKQNHPGTFEALRAFKSRYKKASERAQKAAYCSFYYGGVYFSFKQSIVVDAILARIHELKYYQPGKFALLLSALLSTLSEIVSTVGKQFAQPMKLIDKQNNPKELLLARSKRDRGYNVFDCFSNWITHYSLNSFTDTKSFSVTADFKNFLSGYTGEIGCFYADPPYTIDHYSRFYHILESIALYDYPKLAVMTKAKMGNTIMRGLYRDDRYQSPFCIPSKVSGAFNDLFFETSRFKCPLVLSYSPYDKDSDSRPRLLSIDEIITLGSNFFKSIEIIPTRSHTHRKLNKAENNSSDTLSNGEVLILFK